VVAWASVRECHPSGLQGTCPLPSTVGKLCARSCSGVPAGPESCRYRGGAGRPGPHDHDLARPQRRHPSGIRERHRDARLPGAGEPRTATVPLSRWQGLLHTSVAASAAQAVPAARVSPAHRDAVGTPALRLPCATRFAWPLPGRALVQALRANTDPGGFNAPRAGGHGPPVATPGLATAKSQDVVCRPDPCTVAWASVRECHQSESSRNRQ